MTVAPLNLAWATQTHVRGTSSALGEPDWLIADRLAALEKVAELPAEPNQLYITYIDLRAVDFAAVEPYPPTPAAESASEAQLPAGAAALVHVDERAVASCVLSDEARAAGLVVSTIAEAAQEHPELLKGILQDGGSLPADDAFGQVARALYSLGLFIHVPDGVELQAPIVLRWSAGASGFGLISRTVISVGKNARASVYEEQVASAGATAEAGARADSIWWGTTEVTVGDGSSLAFSAEQDFGLSTAAFVTRQARLGRDATVNWAVASVGSRLYRSRLENLLEGRGANVSQVEIQFGDGRQLFDLTSYTRHLGEDGTSDLLSKGVFTDRARGYIKGLIEIPHSGRGTDSFLGEFSMLLERTARSVTIPSLEIDQPDCRRAMHSSSVGPIDETQIFYLMSRGLSEDQARKAIVMGFLDPVVARIPLPEAQDRLRARLERKWPEGAAATESAA
ncbi:MAG: SufD family Fe-S cluster assembly protein [Candidatus Limnocylindrales bacterium]